MFKCKVCSEKDARIGELKEQIAYFKALLNPPPRINKYEFEADNILNGANKESVSNVIDVEAEQNENAKIQREQDLIFSGNYSESN